MTQSKKPIVMAIKHAKKLQDDTDGDYHDTEEGEYPITLRTNPQDEQFYIDFKKLTDHHYNNYDDWASCETRFGCVDQKTSYWERIALINFGQGFTLR